MNVTCDIVVVGGGIFGITAALELNERGHHVAVLDPGPLPHPLASSTDISKVVRAEYGSDDTYTALAERAREGWLQWNEAFGKTLYHDVGIAMLTRGPMAPDSFEYENFEIFRERGHHVERLDAGEIARRFPAFNAELYVDGYFHAEAGWVESGRVVEALVEKAAATGVALHGGRTVDGFLEEGGRVTGVSTREGEQFHAGEVIVAAGAWTPLLLPELAPMMKAVGQPVFHLKPAEPALFAAPNLTTFAADVTKSGWYGVPLHPAEGVVKIANHGPGTELHPANDERIVTGEQIERLRAFLAETFPALAGAPIVYTRCCLYCDTFDSHFWIARHPELAGLTVSAGGSGHGFKFGPVLGTLTADAVEARANPLLERFRWRESTATRIGQEGTRYRGE